LEELNSILGDIDIPAGIWRHFAATSPGMLDRHYAPRASMLLFDSRSLTLAHDLIEKVRLKEERLEGSY